MDSDLMVNGRLMFLVDPAWRHDAANLPDEDVLVPNTHLPDPEPDNGTSHETLKEMDLKWTDLALSVIATDATLH